jgi:hypothetical protein
VGELNTLPRYIKERSMGVNLNVREQLPPNSIVFDNESYDNSIIGVTFDDRAIYSYDRMVTEYMEDNECSEEDAIDWIEYNTMRALPYFPEPRPMIVYEGVI